MLFSRQTSLEIAIKGCCFRDFPTIKCIPQFTTLMHLVPQKASTACDIELTVPLWVQEYAFLSSNIAHVVWDTTNAITYYGPVHSAGQFPKAFHSSLVCVFHSYSIESPSSWVSGLAVKLLAQVHYKIFYVTHFRAIIAPQNLIFTEVSICLLALNVWTGCWLPDILTFTLSFAIKIWTFS